MGRVCPRGLSCCGTTGDRCLYSPQFEQCPAVLDTLYLSLSLSLSPIIPPFPPPPFPPSFVSLLSPFHRTAILRIRPLKRTLYRGGRARFHSYLPFVAEYEKNTRVYTRWARGFKVELDFLPRWKPEQSRREG